jgi:hypothetical protein
MFTFERPWEYWFCMIDVLRASPLDDMQQAAAFLPGKLDQTPADQELIRITLSEQAYYRGIFAASLKLGDKLLDL